MQSIILRDRLYLDSRALVFESRSSALLCDAIFEILNFWTDFNEKQDIMLTRIL